MGRGAKGPAEPLPKVVEATVAPPAVESPVAEAPVAAKPAPTPPPPAVEPTACRSVCWGCGAEEPPPPAKPFQTCARCREDGLPPSPFCSKECLKANWPRHKQWHAEQKIGDDQAEGQEQDAKYKKVLSTLQNVMKEQPESEGKSYMGLLMEADSHKLKGSYSKADDLLKQAVALQPENPVAYATMGEIAALKNQPSEAARLYSKAVGLFPQTADTNNPQGLKLWTSSTLSAIFWLNVPGGKPEEHPEWFNDAELKRLTEQLVATAPGDLRSWQTRAFVLCPMPDMPPQWRMPPGGMMRNEAELQEAGRCWQRVQQMTPGDKEAKRPFVMRAAHCFRTAQLVAQQLEQQAAKAGLEADEGAQQEAAEMAAKAAALEVVHSKESQPKEVVPAW